MGQKGLLSAVFALLLLALGLCFLLLTHGVQVTDATPLPATEPSSMQAVPAKLAPVSIAQPTREPQLIRLNVPLIRQFPELPNGCEATSLAMLLNALDYPADKLELAYNFMPSAPFEQVGRVLYGADPETAYPGAPGPDAVGYYCYPPAVAAAANLYLEAEGGRHTARDISGAGLDKLKAHLDEGRPVLVWYTTDLMRPRASKLSQWFFFGTEELYIPYSNLHVAVLYGYQGDTLFLRDPLEINETLGVNSFLWSYEGAGSRALVIVESP